MKKLLSALRLSFSILLVFLLKTPLAWCAPAAFVHPGILHTQADFDRMSSMINAGTQPYLDAYNQLLSSPLSSANWTARATATVIRGGQGDNVALLYIDVARAYQNALLWKITGSREHGDTARDILNAWSSTLTLISGNADRYLAGGLYGYQLANVSEIMRGYSGFNVAQMQSVLLNVFYKPLNEHFLIGNEYGTDHNDAYIQNYWANWDLSNMAAVVAIGIFCDRADIYDMGIEYFKHGAGNGSIYNAIPFLHPNGLAQWQESGRDQAHTQLGLGLMAATSEMAWHQGDDLYGWANNRFLRAAEYVAKYNNGDDALPFASYEWGSGTNGDVQSQTVISSASRNELRPVWEMIYNHYVNRVGLSAPNVSARASLLRPETGPNTAYASSFDQPGLGTLLYTRPAVIDSSAQLPGGNIPDGLYRFIVRHSDKALDADGSSKGANVQQWTYTGGANQHWLLTHLGGGEYKVINQQAALSLDVTSKSLANGGNLELWSYNAGDNQKFAFIPVGEGYVRITPANSNKAADIDAASGTDGANAQQWRYVLGANQQWRLEPVLVAVRLQSYNYPTRFLRHSSFRAKIDSSISPLEDSQFKMVAGLTNARGVSFESVNYPGCYLRARTNGEVWLDANDSTASFSDSATFRRVPGLADPQKSSYQLWSNAAKYLRHANYIIYAQSGSGDLFNGDATFSELNP